MYSNVSDEELIRILRRLTAGNPTLAWEEWTRRYLQKATGVVVRVLKRYGAPPDLADDALQQGSFQFLSRLSLLDEARPPVPYFLGTVEHAAFDVLRQEFRFRQLRERLARWNAAQPDKEGKRRDTVDHLLGIVSPEARKLLTERYIEGHSVGKMAAERGIPVNQMYRRLHRARCQARAREQGDRDGLGLVYVGQIEKPAVGSATVKDGVDPIGSIRGTGKMQVDCFTGSDQRRLHRPITAERFVKAGSQPYGNTVCDLPPVPNGGGDAGADDGLRQTASTISLTSFTSVQEYQANSGFAHQVRQSVCGERLMTTIGSLETKPAIGQSAIIFAMADVMEDMVASEQFLG
jgi:DNA-directed RNA polymerase specialized sigma24 family protein